MACRCSGGQGGSDGGMRAEGRCRQQRFASMAHALAAEMEQPLTMLRMVSQPLRRDDGIGHGRQQDSSPVLLSQRGQDSPTELGPHQ